WASTRASRTGRPNMAGGWRSGSGRWRDLPPRPASSRGDRNYVLVDLSGDSASHPHSSCPGLTRASTSWAPRGKRNVDGRDELGHDGGGLFVHRTMPHRAPLLRIAHQRDEAVDAVHEFAVGQGKE